jgi:hypothetical protein
VDCVRFIDVDLDGLVVRALLNEAAPVTADAVWAALPFSGRAVHAQISGDMFRMLDEVPVAQGLALESAVMAQHPGQLVFYPPIREIAFCVGEAEFSAFQGRFEVTPLADIEGDFSEWAERGNRLHETGTRPIRFTRSADQDTPFRHPEGSGARLQLQFGGAQLPLRLLDELSADFAAAVLAALPVTGSAVNSTWAGPQTLLPATVGLGEAAAGARSTTFHWPGYLYYDPDTDELVFTYGDATANVKGIPQPLVPIARASSSLDDYRAVAASQLLEGAKPFTIQTA